MTFKVEISEPAEFDLAEVFDYIAADSIAMAEKWLKGFTEILSSLEEMPYRFPEIPESKVMRSSYRATLHHSHRIVYRVDEEFKTVFIVRIYHEARRPLDQRDLPG